MAKRDFKKLAELCSSRGDTFIAIDASEGKSKEKIFFERGGEVKTQHLVSYRRGSKLKEDYMRDPAKFDSMVATRHAMFEEHISKLCESRGDVFLALELTEKQGKKKNYQVHYQREGEHRVQNLTGYRREKQTISEYQESRRKRWPAGSGLYKFYIGEDLVYVGRTTDYHTRLKYHFKESILRNSFKGSVDKIEICPMDNESDMNIYEVYLITLLKPLFNTRDITKDLPSFQLPELEFQEITGWR